MEYCRIAKSPNGASWAPTTRITSFALCRAVWPAGGRRTHGVVGDQARHQTLAVARKMLGFAPLATLVVHRCSIRRFTSSPKAPGTPDAGYSGGGRLAATEPTSARQQRQDAALRRRQPPAIPDSAAPSLRPARAVPTCSTFGRPQHVKQFASDRGCHVARTGVVGNRQRRVAQQGGVRPQIEFSPATLLGARWRGRWPLHRGRAPSRCRVPRNVDRPATLRQLGKARPLLSSFSKVPPANGTSTT